MKHLFFSLLALCLLVPFVGQSQDFDYDAYLASMKKHRTDYADIFIVSNTAPILPQDIPHLQYFAVDTAFRVTAAFEKAMDVEPFEMPTYSGITKKFIQYGTLTFAVKGDSCQLALYRNIQSAQNPLYRDLLFLPVKDATSNKSTYGGGRYLDIREGEIKNGQIVLDFNKLYNPYCAYGTGWNCPVPPEENHLKVAIEAGEKNYTGPMRDRRE